MKSPLKRSPTPIEIVPYDSNWPTLFEIHAAEIKKALGDHCIAIHHIGSTSVPGLAAKPKIDMIAVVKDPVNILEKLEKIGFSHRGEYNIPLHYGFSKRGEDDINLHVYEEDHAEVELNLVFRNYLRETPTARNEYAAFKKMLLLDASSQEKSNSSFTNYTLKKGSLIRKILHQAGFKRLRVLKCTDEVEWNAAKHFRQKYFFDSVPLQDPYTWTFHHAHHDHMILYQGTDIIGYAHIQLWPEERAALRIIVIEESIRGLQFGSWFLAFLEKWLKCRRYKSLHVESSPAALNFYKKNGYREMPFHDPDGHEGHAKDIAVGKMLL